MQTAIIHIFAHVDNTFQILKDARKAKKISGQVIADQLGITRELLSKYERGHSSPRADVLKKWCNILDFELIIMKRLFL